MPDNYVNPQQWARAEALKAMLGGPQPPMSMKALERQVNLLAELILTGQLPPPPPGTNY